MDGMAVSFVSSDAHSQTSRDTILCRWGLLLCWIADRRVDSECQVRSALVTEQQSESKTFSLGIKNSTNTKHRQINTQTLTQQFKMVNSRCRKVVLGIDDIFVIIGGVLEIVSGLFKWHQCYQNYDKYAACRRYALAGIGFAALALLITR